MFLREPIFCRKPKYIIETGTLKAPVKVALTGDWHISRIVSDKQRRFLKKRLAEIRPDVIILQGDLLDAPDTLDDRKLMTELRKSLKLCTEIAPTVMVLGNHDQVRSVHRPPVSHDDYMSRVRKGAVEEWRAFCRESGVNLLLDSWYEVKGLRIFGFWQDAEVYYCKPGKKSENLPEMKRKIKELYQEGTLNIKNKKVNWFVAHAPIYDLWQMKELRGFSVFSFGHTHGGCVPLGLDNIEDWCGGHWGLISPFKKCFPARYMRGREIINGKVNYIVNAGMVAVQNSAPPPLQFINFLKAAEVTEVIIK